MLPTFAAQTILRIRPGIKDSRGTTVPDWSHTETALIAGCSVQPAATKLDLDGRVLGITDGMTIYAPPGADIQAGDHLRIDNQDYEIDGEPRPWTSATGLVSHIQINAVRWSG